MAARQAANAKGHARSPSVSSQKSVTDASSVGSLPRSNSVASNMSSEVKPPTSKLPEGTRDSVDKPSAEKTDAVTDERARRRAKNLLKQFYGLEKKEEDKSTPLDINGSNFNQELFMKKLLAEKQLEELMQMDNTYNAEVKSLDSDMKTLVYENYNKFISATDVIKKMRTNVENMESEMEKLRQTMQKISEGSSKVNTSLIEKRNKINQLSGVHGLILKIEFVFELPSTLKKCVDMEAYGQAWRYYSRTSTVLSHYSHLPSFAPINRECDEIMKKVASKLKERLLNELTKPHDLTEAVQILLGLKEPAAGLVKNFIISQRKALHFSLQRGAAFDPSDPEAFGATPNLDGESPNTYHLIDYSHKDKRKPETKESEAPPAPPPPPRPKVSRFDPFLRLAYLHETFLRDLMEFIQMFLRLFISTDTNKQDLSAEDRRAAEDDLWRVVDEIAKEYFATVELFLDAKSPTIGPRNYMDTLVRLDDDIRSFDRHLNGRAKLITRSRYLTNQFLINYAAKEFHAISTSFHDRLLWLQGVCRTLTSVQPDDKKEDAADKANNEIEVRADDLLGLVHHVCSALSRSINEAMSRIEVFAIVDETFMHAHLPAYVQAVFREAAAFWISIFTTIMQFGVQKEPAVSSPVPLLTLMLSKLCLELDTHTITNLYARLIDVLSSGVKRTAVANDLNDVRASAKKNAELLLNRYVELNGNVMSALIRLAIETRNWITAREPRKVSKMWEQITEDFGNIDVHVDQLFDSMEMSSRQSSESSRRISRANAPVPAPIRKEGSGLVKSPTVGDAYMSNIDKLFREHIDVFAPVEYHKGSITTSIVKIILKTLSETIRLKSFGRSGFQQIQIDIEFLRVHLWRFAPEKLLTNMLEEALSSAQSRCLDPLALEPSVIDKILGADLNEQS